MQLPGGDLPIENDPIISRKVSVLVEAPWIVDKLLPLAPAQHRFERMSPQTFTVELPDLSASPVEAFESVEKMMKVYTALLHIYAPNTRFELRVDQIHQRHLSGRQSALKKLIITVNKRDGFAVLAQDDGAGTHASQLVRLALANARVMQALELLAVPEPGWYAVYDVLKFLKNTQHAKGRKTKLRKFIGTASHYRHLGEPNRPGLPPQPPNLNEAREFAFEMLERWIDRLLPSSRVTHPGDDGQ